jgi:hypothetical protein
MLAFGQPQPLPASGPVRSDHLRPCSMPERRKPGPRPMSARSCPASTMDATIGQPSGHRISGCPVDPAGHRPLHPARHGEPEATRTGTDERHGRRSDSLDRQDHKAAHRDTPSPRLWGRRLQLGNPGWPGDSKIANATVTTAATRQLLGVAPPSKPRLGALLSCVGFGWYEERAMGLRKMRCAGSGWVGSADGGAYEDGRGQMCR